MDKRTHLSMQEMQVQFLLQEDLLEKEIATHSSILAWKTPWTEEPGGLQSRGSQRVTYNLVIGKKLQKFSNYKYKEEVCSYSFSSNINRL